MAVHVGLAAEIQRITDGLPRFMRGEASHISGIATREIAQRTPIGRQVDAKTGEDKGISGRLRKGWKPISPRRSGTTWTAGAYNDVSYTRYVEDDTRRHIIPRGGAAAGIILHFHRGGHEVFTRMVHHPGTRGHHMAELGLKETQRQYDGVADERLQAYLDGKRQ